ncbi:hypothetical protein [Rhodococcus sp. 27YEA15]|uniref:hypothetical protein n=1 Tax=Rhodococcus sp. 27YEA15 TaxID=3156259 RepID=UPI003C7D2002
MAGAASVGAATLAVSACSDDSRAQSAEVDKLLAQADRARADATAANAAIALAPERSAALTTISTERTAHATELDAEIARAAGRNGRGTTTEPSDPTTATTGPSDPTTAATPADVAALRTALGESARSAADLARTMSGYRAGLLASVSAACSAQTAVLLP